MSGGDGVGERFVRALAVVDLTPVVEAPLRIGQVGERRLQRLPLQRLVEALVLAERLWVVGPAVRDPHTEP